MRKGLFSVSLLALAGMMFSAVVACTPASEPGPVDPPLGNVYTIEITNKADLQAEWFDNGTGRKVELKATLNGKEQNVTSLIGEGDITITSSNKEAATVTGQMVSPKAAGETTIEATYGDKKDSVKVTVTAHPTNKDLFGTDHEGTLEDPFTNEDALKAAKYEEAHGGFTATEYYFKGEVDAFYHAPGSRGDQCSWYMKPATEGGERFEIYLCKKADASDWVTTDLWKGAIATAHGAFAKYNTQYETGSAVLDKVEGTAPADPVDINATVAEALTAGKALADGDSSWDNYVVTGYVVKKDGTNFFMADEKAAAADDKDMLELYKVADETVLAGLKKNAKVKVKMNLKNYHGQIENSASVVAANFEVLEEGGSWDVTPEPELVKGTIKEFTEDALGNGKQLYEIKGKVVAWKDDASSDGTKYGNFYLEDESGRVYIYGATATETALAWDGESAKYAFTNPQDFLTNEVTKDIALNSVLTMKVTRCDYKQGDKVTIEGTGIVTKVEAGEADPLTGIKLNAETNELTVGDTFQLTASPIPATAELGEVEWKSSDESVAVVTENGMVAALKKGTAVISAEKGELKGECALTVLNPMGDAKVEFNLAEDGDASHADGSEIKPAEGAEVATFEQTVGEVKLVLTDLVKVYGNARDAKGNGALKLGTGSAAASLKIVVPEGYDRVEIAIAGYKANKASISVNGGEAQEIATYSNNGEYTVVKVEPVEGAVTLATLDAGRRAMINSITLVAGGAEIAPVVNDRTGADGEEADALAAPGLYHIWNDQNWCGSMVELKSAVESEGNLIISYNAKATFKPDWSSFDVPGCNFALQIFLKNPECVASTYYTLTVKLFSQKAVACHLNVDDSTKFELQAGWNEISVEYLENANAVSMSLRFEAFDEAGIDNTIIISDAKWEVAPVGLGMSAGADLVRFEKVGDLPCYVVRATYTGHISDTTKFVLFDGTEAGGNLRVCEFVKYAFVELEGDETKYVDLYFDMSSLTYASSQFYPHLAVDGANWNGTNGDVKNAAIGNGDLGQALEVGDTKYVLTGAWQMPTITFTYIGNATGDTTGAKVELDGEAVKLVLSGTSTGANNTMFDVDAQNTSNWGTTAYEPVVVVNDDGTWTMTADVTALGNGTYIIHWFFLGASHDLEQKEDQMVGFEASSVELNGHVYELKVVTMWNRSMICLVVSDAPAA